MNIEDMLARDGIISRLHADDKKQALQALALKAEQATGMQAQEVYAALLQRERLSSTGLGRGIAIPHVKLSGVKAITCLFARLNQPVQYDSHDGEPVDLLFFLLAPEQAGGDHLKALARISRLVRDPATLEGLRSAKDADGLRRVLTKPIASHAA
ncbi:transcriptional regulator [Hyphomicrobium methylovorum]|uniref:PTS sugar transporter subunit IIA n=1 Tax=Hyphomicrobium methylovorum TaxID=84 RepID=UPI0015E735C0|nr:PTS sugar transporter subunit IIA [Hyphomicrobium methylovorum]MBA2125622.1 transcriptional regulator [Hyphomicrobium methylovorum]